MKVGLRITCVPLSHVIYSPPYTTRNKHRPHPVDEFSGPSAPLQRRIFFATPPRLVHRVLHRIQFNLRIRGGDEINAQLVAYPDQVEQHVGHFGAYFIERFGWQLLAFGFCEPLEMFEQFGRFNSEGSGQVLGRVELVPVAVCCESAELIA